MINTIKQYLNMSKGISSLKPDISVAINEIQSLGPEMYVLFENLALGSVEIRHAMMNKFKDLGYTHEDSILLTTDMWKEIKETVRKR